MKNTLIILGAGASKDIYRYFPTGFELIKEINYHLTADKKFNVPGHLSSLTNEVLKGLHCSESDIHLLRQHLWDHVLACEHKYLRFDYGHSISIDNFIHQKLRNGELNLQSKKIAQYAIAFLLIGYEEAVACILDKKPELIDDNWIRALFLRSRNLGPDNIMRKLKVVSFNYDRTFAHLFLRYTRGYLTEEQGSEFLTKNVEYIYGSLGQPNTIPYGLKNDTTDQLRSVLDNFRLIDYDRPKLKWNQTDDFDQIIFLGFGFDTTNIANLNLDNFSKAKKVGTGNGIDSELKMKIENEFGIEVCSRTCTELINEYC